MTDAEILDKLIEAAGTVKILAEAMGVSRQTLWEWRSHLTDKGRIRIYLLAEEQDYKLPKDFLKRALD